MTDGDKKGLVVGLTSTALIFSWFHLKSWYDWNGPVSTAVGKVIVCTSKVSSEDGTVYSTTYEFKDESGRDWKDTTRGIRYCLPPGSLLKVSWPEGEPEKSYAVELNPVKQQP